METVIYLHTPGFLMSAQKQLRILSHIQQISVYEVKHEIINMLSTPDNPCTTEVEYSTDVCMFDSVNKVYFYLHLQDVGNRVTLKPYTSHFLCTAFFWGVIWDLALLGMTWNPIWDPNLEPRFGTPIWDPDLGPQFGTPIWDPDLGP
jgi:hypothetical protein